MFLNLWIKCTILLGSDTFRLLTSFSFILRTHPIPARELRGGEKVSFSSPATSFFILKLTAKSGHSSHIPPLEWVSDGLGPVGPASCSYKLTSPSAAWPRGEPRLTGDSVLRLLAPRGSPSSRAFHIQPVGGESWALKWCLSFLLTVPRPESAGEPTLVQGRAVRKTGPGPGTARPTQL